jgi:hypothetical protein
LRSEIQTRRAPHALHALLEGIVDYAGLFPPANLSLEKALQNYSEYRAGPHAWMLGRFIVQALRLPDVAGLLPRLVRNESLWKISALIKDFDSDMELVAKFNRESGKFATVDSVELAPELCRKVEMVPSGVFHEYFIYFEIPLDASVERLHEIAQKGARAKARTGGVRPEAIPPASALASFLVNCVSTRTQFKATAGLHHPVRSQRPLTYEPHAAKGKMHGFLNLMIAMGFALSGEPVDLIRDVLSDEDASSFSLSDVEARWKQKMVPVASLQKNRELFVSFGSCSFDEPIEGLISLGWI